jgi:aspartate beta-hydroxylase
MHGDIFAEKGAAEAMTLLAARRPDAAEASLRMELQRHPNDCALRLLLGAASEAQGRNLEARAHYLAALTAADTQGLWTEVESTPLRLRPLVSHAATKVARERRDLVLSLLESLVRKYGERDLRRVRTSISIYLGDTAAHFSDERQRPVFMFFPEIRAQPYYDKDEFAWVAGLEAQTEIIRSELLAVMEGDHDIELFFDGDRSPFKKLMADWDAFFFYRYGHRYDRNHQLCPATSRALDELPLCHVPGHAPETLFSFIAPRGCIRPHRGITNTRLVAHLPLIIPGPCALTVADLEHQWRFGEVVIFDDTFVHSAVNEADTRRALLLMDVWHPDLTTAERQALTDLISAIADFGALPPT